MRALRVRLENQRIRLSGLSYRKSLALQVFYVDCAGSPRGPAYASDASGKSEIYVQAFSEDGVGLGRKWQVSDSGGRWPRWRRDGKELLYLGAGRRIVAVEVKTGG